MASTGGDSTMYTFAKSSLWETTLSKSSSSSKSWMTLGVKLEGVVHPHHIKGDIEFL